MRILLFALLLLCHAANAQFKIYNSPNVNVGNGFNADKLELLGYVDGKYYACNARTATLYSYDGKMGLVAEVKADVKVQGEFTRTLFVNDKLYLVVIEKEGDKNKLVAYEISLDGKTKKAEALTAALGEITLDAKLKFDILKGNGILRAAQSPDGSKIAFYYSGSSVKKENVKITAIMLDSKFNKLWSKKGTLPFEYTAKSDYGSLTIDNLGNACATVQTETDHYDGTYLHCFNSAGNMQKGTYPVSTSKYVKVFDIIPDNKGNFYVAANYHTFKDASSGIKLLMYSSDSTKATWTKDYNHAKMYTRDRSKGIDALEFSLSNFGILPNGNIYATQEQRNDGYLLGILFTTFSSTGELLNATFQPKAQASELMTPAPALVKDGIVYLNYNFFGEAYIGIDVDQEPGFYVLAYDGKTVKKTFLPDTKISGILRGSSLAVDDSHLLMFFGVDFKTAFVSLFEIK